MERERVHGVGMLIMLMPTAKRGTYHFLPYFIGEDIITWAHLLQGKLGNVVSWAAMCSVQLHFYRRTEFFGQLAVLTTLSHSVST